MKLVFMGTPEFAAVALKALITAGHDIVAVYSQPPRPAGRGYAEKKSAVHEMAAENGIAVRTPVSLKQAAEQDAFASLGAAAAVVVAYGLILPRAVLESPLHGCFNIHASLLPRWRGAAPIQRAIMAGDAETGVTIMRMDEGLDTGPMCQVGRVAISPETTAGTLHDTLAQLGAKLMVETLSSFPLDCQAQPETGISYAKKIDKSEARIDFSRDAKTLRNHIHGLAPFPGAWCLINGMRVKILQCATVEASGPAGVTLDDRLTIACGRHAVRLLKIQREGKGPMAADVFLRGFPVAAGTAL